MTDSEIWRPIREIGQYGQKYGGRYIKSASKKNIFGMINGDIMKADA
jgi:hypothetical protein